MSEEETQYWVDLASLSCLASSRDEALEKGKKRLYPWDRELIRELKDTLQKQKEAIEETVKPRDCINLKLSEELLDSVFEMPYSDYIKQLDMLLTYEPPTIRVLPFKNPTVQD